MKLLRFFIIYSLLLFPVLTNATHGEMMDDSELLPVTIQLHWQHQFQFAGIYAAIAKGYYRDAGLNVTIKTGFKMPYDEVESGEVEFGLAGAGIITQYLNGRPFVALGAMFQESPYAWLVRSDSGIYTASDFIGKTLALQSETDDLMAIFIQEKVNTDLINFIPSSENDIPYLISGKVDALTAYVTNEPFFLEEKGIGWRTISAHDYGLHFYSDVLFTTQNYAEQNPEVVNAFREATKKGWRYTTEHTDEIIQLVQDHYNTQNKSPAHIRFEAGALLKLSLYPTVDFGHMTLERWQQIAKTYQSLAYVDHIDNIEQFLYQPAPDNTPWLNWLVGMLAGLSLLVLIGYQINRQHNRLLHKRIQQQTASLESELNRRKELELAAKQEQAWLQAVLDNTADSVITLNQRGIIQNYNKASVQLFGYKAEEVIGQNITKLMPAEYRDQHRLGMARFLSTKQSKIIGKPVELEILHKSGTQHKVELTVSAFDWQDHFIFIGIARDTSAQKEQQNQLLQAKWEAERANQAKSEFLSAMSHELRTPLNNMLGFAQLFRSEPDANLSSKQSQYVQQIISSGENLLSLVNDVVDLSKIEAGAIKTNLEPVAISTLLDDCLPMLEALANKHGITIEQENIDDAVVAADFIKLKQAFINIVINAIKYNEKNGFVYISTQEQDNHLQIIIRDTGPGIVMGKQDKVFTAFERLGQERINIGGSGVGLSVSKRFIEAMGGTIDFVSAERQGSKFWIELPLTNDQPYKTDHQHELLSPMRRGADQTIHNKVLYIEDNPANIRLMEVFLSRMDNIDLLTCRDAETGIDMIRENRPDLVLLDINLAGMSGLDAAKILREDPALQDLPLIALTAAAMQHNKDAAGDLFNSYITKPIDFNELTKVLNYYF